jgi:autotransporter family porin
MLLAAMQGCGEPQGDPQVTFVHGPLPRRFSTLPPGATLPSGAECVDRVKRSDWEPRPRNARANQTRGASGASINGASAAYNARMAPRIDGNFTGTTDEIIQWGACKWGFDEDIVRAVAVMETWWRQDTVGDDGVSYGLLQVRSTVHVGTLPHSRDSTAYAVDYALAWRRACYEGEFTWFDDPNRPGGIVGKIKYSKGDEWGCVGAWFSGNWYDGDENKPYSGANAYIKGVKQYLVGRTWTTQSFANDG